MATDCVSLTINGGSVGGTGMIRQASGLTIVF